MKCLNNMERIQITNSLMMQLFNLYENKGRSFYYKELFEKDDLIMAKQTLEEDIISIAAFLNLDITANRLKLLANTKKNYVAKKKDEFFILNIKDVLTKIQLMSKDFTLTTNEVTDLSTILFRGYDSVRYRKKRTTNSKIDLTFEEMSSQEQLTKLIEQFQKIARSKKYEYLMILANFYIDFLKIEPFTNHNQLIGLLIIYTVIAKNFQVCRYQSFFSIFSKLKDRFELAISQANYDWEKGLSQTDALVRVFIDTIEQMNNHIREKEHIYEFEKKMNKTNSVEYIIFSGPVIFTKNDIRQKLPLVSESTINRTLQILKQQEIIKPLGQGRSAQWQRLKEAKQKFNPEQLSLF